MTRGLSPKRALLALTALLCVAALSGCYTVRYTTGAPTSGGQTTQKSHHIIEGLVTVSDPVNVRTICPQGFSEIQHQHTFVDGLLGVLTRFLGVEIYHPTTFTITCADGTSHQLTAEELKQAHLDAEEVSP